MGIQSASATFMRFYVPEPITEDFWNFVDDRLKAGVFKECEDGQERSSGFSSWDDFFDTTFAYGSYHKGEYAPFHFRVDQRKIPPILLKQYVREEIQKYRKEHEDRQPSRKERQEIKENVQAWLLSQALPQPSAYEVVWNPQKKWMLFGTTSTKIMEIFLEHFEKLFRIYPVPLYHVHWALNMLPLEDRQKDILNSMVSVQSSQALQEGKFLGYEFLTWLWFFMETSEGILRFSENRQVEVYLGERLILSHPEDGKERIICTTQAHSLYEARTALQQGKLVEEMQLTIKIGGEEYPLTLDTSLWTFKGLKTPKQLPDREEEDSDGRFLEKMYFLENVFDGLDALYGHFLSQRLSPSWESDSLPLLKQWIAGNTSSESSTPF